MCGGASCGGRVGNGFREILGLHKDDTGGCLKPNVYKDYFAWERKNSAVVAIKKMRMALLRLITNGMYITQRLDAQNG